MADPVQPEFVPDPLTLPAPEQAQPDTIRPGSRMAILGVFVEVTRKRFSEAVVGNGFPWPWNPDIKKTKIAIESAFNEDTAHRNFKPGIFIDIDDQVHGRVVLGDRVTQNLRTGTVAFWDLATVPILIECVAAKRAESATVGDLTGTFLHASSDLIQAKFGFHDMTPVTISRTQPFSKDKDTWVTSVTFTVQHVMRWTNKPTAPLLQEILIEATGSDADNPTAFFEEIALGWRSRQAK